MSSVLTTRHKSIIAYLSANNIPDTAATLRAELGLGEDVFDIATTKKYEMLLERKWTGVVRLQKKILDLESRNTALQSELDSATPTTTSARNQDPAGWLPEAPPRHSLESHREPINCIAFHPVFSSIASGSDDCTIKIWDWELGELERTIKGHTRAVLDLDFGGPRGGILLASCSSDLTIKLWDPANEYKNVRTLAGHDHSVSAVRFVPSGAAGATSSNLLVSASRDQNLKIWDITTGYCVRTLEGHAGWVREVSPSVDGRFLLSVGDDMTTRLWDISVSNPESKVTMVGHEHYIECCAFAPPASYEHLAALAGLKKPPHPSSTAEFMATGSRDKTIKLWDSHGTCLKTLVGHDNWVRAIAFHPGGKFILSVSDDKSLRCWDLSQEGKSVKPLLGAHERFITCLKWAPGILKDKSAPSDFQIRCVIATAGVDQKLRIFAN